MTQHTPGPWEWDIRDDDYTDTDPDELLRKFKLERLDKRDSGSGAGFTLEGENRSVLIPWDYESYNAGIYIRKADAKLIAAAPDLLEACKEATDIIWSHHDFRDKYGTPLHRAYDSLNTAVTKATE